MDTKLLRRLPGRSITSKRRLQSHLTKKFSLIFGQQQNPFQDVSEEDERRQRLEKMKDTDLTSQSDLFNYRVDIILDMAHTSKKSKNMKDKDILELLEPLKGLRFGFNHSGERVNNLITILRSRAQICSEEELAQYIQLCNEVGLRDETLYTGFFKTAKLSFEGMKYTSQLNLLYQWRLSRLYIYEHEIDSGMKRRFIDRSRRRFEKLERYELIKLLMVLEWFGLKSADLGPIVDVLLEKLDFKLIVNQTSQDLNHLLELAHLITQHVLFNPAAHKEKKKGENVEKSGIFKRSENGDEKSEGLTKEELFELELDVIRLLEAFAVLNPLQHYRNVKDADMQYDFGLELGITDEILDHALVLGYQTLEAVEVSEPSLVSHFNEVLERKSDFNVIEINATAELLGLHVQVLERDMKLALYRVLEKLILHEPEIIAVSMAPESLEKIVVSLLQDLGREAFAVVELKPLAFALIQLMYKEMLDEHMAEIDDLGFLVDFLKLARDRMRLDKEVYEEVLEAVELSQL